MTAEQEPKSTAPKPFVFVLMPFERNYKDVYKIGIKGTADAAGAYAERLDEQIFTEGINRVESPPWQQAVASS